VRRTGDRSCGIHVADLAEVPVVDRSCEVLDPVTEEVLAEVRDFDPAEITPADLLAKVERWQSELDGGE